ncbi:MAG: hypothetical protein LBG80_03005 [Bacteroidales bacterium]|jgi:hypothetical protein|nr:hypothetical protein [Bacteroidales bacterium]
MSTDRNNGKSKVGAKYQSAIIIANPMYDTVFKKLMENERIAKFFLSTILEQQVVSLDIRPQEYTYKSDPDLKKNRKRKRPEPEHNIGYSIFRIDFMATIITATGEKKKILIEIQKSYDEEDLMRFRNYLAEQYKRIDKVNGVDSKISFMENYDFFSMINKLCTFAFK